MTPHPPLTRSPFSHRRRLFTIPPSCFARHLPLHKGGFSLAPLYLKSAEETSSLPKLCAFKFSVKNNRERMVFLFLRIEPERGSKGTCQKTARWAVFPRHRSARVAAGNSVRQGEPTELPCESVNPNHAGAYLIFPMYVRVLTSLPFIRMI